MANSSIVITLKNAIINDLCDDPNIDDLIDSSKYHGRKLRGKHIFNYNKNPETITDTSTFITVMESIGIRDRNGTFIDSTLSIYIYSHNGHMDLPDIYLVDDEYTNRNDYLAFLIDEKFNGSTKYDGHSELQCVSNDEFVATKEYNGRRLIFKTIDTNDSMCKRW